MGIRTRLVALVAAATTGVGLMLVPAPGIASASTEHDYPISVMTRNVYLGADIQRPIAATAGKTGVEALLALGHANHETRAIVDQTNFPRRSELLAAEIAEHQPELIGLQEVALWRHGPMQLDQLGVANAETVDYDFLAILLQDLREQGVPYKAVSVQTESDVEAPSFLGNPFAGTGTDASDVRLTMRDVILMKPADGHFKAVASGSGQYAAKLQLSVAGLPMSFVRGYNWVDVRAGADTFRFVNTHLEAFSSGIALAQAAELLGTVAGDPGRTTVIACDCNSDPLNGTTKPGDPTPHWAPYRAITGAGGFTDMWLEKQPPEPGFTSGFSETVDDPTNAKIDHRIDMVFARTASGETPVVLDGEVTGVDPDDKDLDPEQGGTGLWPSDHGGVVVRLDGLS